MDKPRTPHPQGRPDPGTATGTGPAPAAAFDLPFRRAVGPLLFLTLVFFCNFLSRICLAPLLPEVELDLGLSHGQSGSLFLLIGLGNATGLILNGFISARLGHKRTIAASAMFLGLAVMAASACESLGPFRLALFGVGLAAGTYLPSGIASIMALVRRADWGKGVSVHEMAPNGSFLLAPILAEAALALTGWRDAFLVLGAGQVLLGLAFLRLGRGSMDPGRPPVPSVVLSLARRPEFWLLAYFFALGVGGGFSTYSMLPLFLTDLGWTRAEANQLLAASRVGAFFMPFVAGYFVDRIGARPMMAITFALNCLALAGLSLASGPWLAGLALVQPLFAVTYFPAGFTALSTIFGPEERSTAVSMITPISIFCGMGLMPTIIGHLGDIGMFRHGFGLVAGLVFVGLVLTTRLKLPQS